MLRSPQIIDGNWTKIHWSHHDMALLSNLFVFIIFFVFHLFIIHADANTYALCSMQRRNCVCTLDPLPLCRWACLPDYPLPTAYRAEAHSQARTHARTHPHPLEIDGMGVSHCCGVDSILCIIFSTIFSKVVASPCVCIQYLGDESVLLKWHLIHDAIDIGTRISYHIIVLCVKRVRVTISMEIMRASCSTHNIR